MYAKANAREVKIIYRKEVKMRGYLIDIISTRDQPVSYLIENKNTGKIIKYNGGIYDLYFTDREEYEGDD
jgi:hypothetical protein